MFDIGIFSDFYASIEIHNIIQAEERWLNRKSREDTYT